MKNKKGIILSILGILGLILITTGVTYAFFNYAKEGTTDNTITTGTITFLYTETSGVGRGISISDAFPISDTQGKAQTGEGKVFDFKVTSTTQMNASIPYEVTVRKKATSTLDESAVKLYLTKVDGDTETEVLLGNYDNLDQTSKVSADSYIEKTIYNGKVPANSTNYEQNFRLRMWIDSGVKFSPNSDGTYPYNDKSFTITVNVYANAKVVTEEDIDNESKAEISSLKINGTELPALEGQDYDYKVNFFFGINSVSIDVETISEYATVTVEKLDSLAYSSSLKRLSSKKTLDLVNGDNYFKITVTSENGEVESEYKIKIVVSDTIELDYSGHGEVFVATKPGNYLLEVWGAQGYSINNYIGGYGGYSSGVYEASINENLYISVGGQGFGGLVEDGLSYAGKGGGATYINTVRGSLSDITIDNVDKILIVAGGGGSSAWTSSNGWAGTGGSGGGFKGNAGISANAAQMYTPGGGGSQETGGYAGNSCYSGSFGTGAIRDVALSNSADGGAGFYGGGCSWGSAGGGGSGYIGNPLLSDKTMYCYNCATSDDANTKTISVGDTEVSSDPVSGYAKKGNGYAKITYLGE